MDHALRLTKAVRVANPQCDGTALSNVAGALHLLPQTAEFAAMFLSTIRASDLRTSSACPVARRGAPLTAQSIAPRRSEFSLTAAPSGDERNNKEPSLIFPKEETAEIVEQLE
jgi:hypothetical protein